MIISKYYRYQTPDDFDNLLICADGDALVGIWFDGQKYYAQTLNSEPTVAEMCHNTSLPPILQDTIRWLDIYFDGGMPNFTPHIVLYGSAFRQEVWRILLTIPYGHTVTYGDIARRMATECGLPLVSARAVGGAVGHNPVSLIIPCHRVIGADGTLTGYAGGIEQKKKLLEMERRGLSIAKNM